MPVMVDVGPGRGRGYVQITDHYPEPGQLVMGAALDARRQAAVSAAFDDLAQNPDHSTVGWWLYTAFPISHVGEGHRAQLCGNYADAIDQLGEILRREPLSYWAVLELGGGGPEVRRDQVLASGQATVGTTYLVRDTGRGRRFQPLVAGRARARVAGDFHTIPDREAGWQMLTKAMADLQADFAAAGVATSHNTAYRLYWDLPLHGAGAQMAQWKVFADAQEQGRKDEGPGSWQVQYVTAGPGGPDSAWRKEWDEYALWLTRIADLRKLARAAGIALRTPEPPAPDDLPSTLSIKDIPDALANAARKVGDYGKEILIGAGVVGAALLVAVAAKG